MVSIKPGFADTTKTSQNTREETNKVMRLVCGKEKKKGKERKRGGPADLRHEEKASGREEPGEEGRVEYRRKWKMNMNLPVVHTRQQQVTQTTKQVQAVDK